MKKNLIALAVVSLISPVAAFAATCPPVNTGIEAVICKIGNILNMVIPVLVVLGVVYFIWGVISYVIGTDEEEKKSAKGKIIYGIIGLVVIVGIWGLVNIVTNTFGIQNANTPNLPKVPTYGI